MLDAQGVEQEYRGWIYRDLLRPIAEVDSEGNVTARYVYLDGAGSRQNGMHQLATRLGANQDTSLPFAGSNVPEFIELLDASGAVAQRLRLIVNQVGTVQAVVDVATGEVVQRLEHDEFGRVLLDSNPGLQPFGFAGGLVDADTGLVRFGARDYEPLVGRWTARDPVRLAGGAASGYVYAKSDPANLVDPFGLLGTGVGVEACSYYDGRCEENGGSYYCEEAPKWCRRFGESTWANCTRECLQDCDAYTHGSDRQSGDYDDDSQECRGSGEAPDNSDPWSDGDNFACHFACYIGCGLGRGPLP